LHTGSDEWRIIFVDEPESNYADGIDLGEECHKKDETGHIPCSVVSSGQLALRNWTHDPAHKDHDSSLYSKDASMDDQVVCRRVGGISDDRNETHDYGMRTGWFWDA